MVVDEVIGEGEVITTVENPTTVGIAVAAGLATIVENMNVTVQEIDEIAILVGIAIPVIDAKDLVLDRQDEDVHEIGAVDLDPGPRTHQAHVQHHDTDLVPVVHVAVQIHP